MKVMQPHPKRRRTWAVWDNMMMAFQTLRDHTYRSLLTSMGVTIGVVIIIAVASVLNGFRSRVVEEITQFSTRNIYLSRRPPITMAHPTAEIRNRKRFELADAWAIRDECTAVQFVSPEIQTGVGSVKAERQEMFQPSILGTYPEARDTRNLELEEGRFFTGEEVSRAMPVCIIGWKVRNILFPQVSCLGKTVSIEGLHFRVIGAAAKFRDVGVEEEGSGGDSMIYVPYSALLRWRPFLKEDLQITAVAREGQLAKAIEEITELMRRRRHVSWNSENDFEVDTASSLVAAFDKIVFAVLAVMFALSTVAFLVGGVGVMNVMFASVKERTREIGLRRAIGARRRDITWQFLVESMTLTGAGGLLGVALGEGLMRALITVLPMVPCNTPMWARLFGFIGSASVGLVFGLLPAISAARLDPIKALRYE